MSYSSKKKLAIKVLSNDSYAALYHQLSHLEDAGIPINQAFEIIDKHNPKIKPYIEQIQKYISQGSTITEAGVKAGVFNRVDKELLVAGESSGRLTENYKQLAELYELKAKRLKKIKSQCYLPVVTLIIALFVQPIPALFLNQISTFEYLINCFSLLLKVALIIYLIFKLPHWLTKGSLQFLGLKNWVYNIQYKLPILSTWLIHKQVNGLLASLGLMLSAGIPILDALPKAIDTINNPILKNQFRPIILATNKGSNLSVAIANIEQIDDQAKALIVAGESSGKLAETLTHIASMGNETINIQEDLFAQWLPKIIYFVVIGWIATTIIKSYSLNTSTALL